MDSDNRVTLGIRDRLEQWHPAMREYLAYPALSSGFVARSLEEGLSAALEDRSRQDTGPTTAPRLARGAFLHAVLTGDETVVARVSPQHVKTRRGDDWTDALEEAAAANADLLLLDKDYDLISRAILSLFRADTPAKEEILGLMAGWSGATEWEVTSEVSWLWRPLRACGETIDGAVCKLRQDAVAHRGDHWVTAQVKTTELPIGGTSFDRRFLHAFAGGAAFYQAGQRELFGDQAFTQVYILAQLTAPYPWRIMRLDAWEDKLEEIWYNQFVPEIEAITESLARGERYGPEERGLFAHEDGTRNANYRRSEDIRTKMH